MKWFCLWFVVFSLLLVFLSGKVFGVVDFLNILINGFLGFVGNVKNEKGIFKVSIMGGKNG